jgi:hypothetical protein
MAFLGAACMGIWNDLSGYDEARYAAWLTHEHMPERLTAPGFLRGRRYVALESAPRRYFHLYEVNDIQSLKDKEYLAMLNSPTEWTRLVMPHLTNFLRLGLRTVISRGAGMGGGAATLHFASAADSASSIEKLVTLSNEATRDDAIVALHLGAVDAAIGGEKTEEVNLRGTEGHEGDVGFVLMIEAAEYSFLKEAARSVCNCVERTLSLESPVTCELYQLSFVLQ